MGRNSLCGRLVGVIVVGELNKLLLSGLIMEKRDIINAVLRGIAIAIFLHVTNVDANGLDLNWWLAMLSLNTMVGLT